eukprot:182527_1
MRISLLKSTLLIIFISFLSACGGGGGGGGSSSSSPNSVSGFLVAASVDDATCELFKITAGAKVEPKLASGSTSNGQVIFGSFDYTGNALIECTGGTYTDEATNTPNTNAPDMNAVVEI